MTEYYILKKSNCDKIKLKTVIFPKTEYNCEQLLICIRLWLKMGYQRLITENWVELTPEYLHSIIKNECLCSYFEHLADKIKRKIIITHEETREIETYDVDKKGPSLILCYTKDDKWGLYGFEKWIKNNQF